MGENRKRLIAEVVCCCDAEPTVPLCKWQFLLPVLSPDFGLSGGKEHLGPAEPCEEEKWDGLGRFFKAILVGRPESPWVGGRGQSEAP